jgi:hypothetical protein
MAKLLGKESSIEKVLLPSYKDLPEDQQAWVELYDTLNADDILSYDTAIGSNKTMGILVKLIKDWNFEDDNGNKIPVTVENLGKLKIEDLTPLIQRAEKITSVMDNAKKNLSTSKSMTKSSS